MKIQDIRDSLERLPEKLIEDSYYLDVVQKKVQFQYDSLFEKMFKKYLINEGEDFNYYHYNGWVVVMERKGE